MSDSSSEVFELDLSSLLGDPETKDFGKCLEALDRISTQEEFNSFCQTACARWEKTGLSDTEKFESDFQRKLQVLDTDPHVDRIIETAWGRVVVTNYVHPEVEKFLVVKEGSYLALEKHREKNESLEVREGVGLLLSRSGSGPLCARRVAPGDTSSFAPGEEHCLIGLENLLIFERSTDPKGMDQDLIFIFEPNA